VHSHPDLKPCDVYKGPKSFAWGYGAPVFEEISDFMVAKAPRFGKDYYWHKVEHNYSYWTEWEARLEEYHVLYNISDPGPEWWGWRLSAWLEEAAKLKNSSLTLPR
jgi:hypothetical protein